MSYADHKVKVTVTESHCPKYKEGDVICFEGAMLDKEKSDGVCMVAMNGPYQCTDCGETVKFMIESVD